MSNLPTFSEDKSPDRIQPEELEVADTYIATEFSMETAADVLGITKYEVHQILKKRPVRAYINQCMAEIGHTHMPRLQKLVDSLIDKKLEELDEAEIGSSKDITDLIKLAIELTKVRAQLLKEENSMTVGKQTNVQINEYGGNYTGFMKELLKDS